MYLPRSMHLLRLSALVLVAASGVPDGSRAAYPPQLSFVSQWKTGDSVILVHHRPSHGGGKEKTAPPSEPAPVSSPSVTSLTFMAMEGAANPAAQTLNLTNTGGGTLSWSLSDNATWLTVSPTSGTTTTETDAITVTVDVSGMTSNTYSGLITLSTQGAAVTTQQISVTLTVTAPSPIISHNPTALSFVGVQGGSNPTSQSLSIRNTGTGTLTWTVSASAPWLTITPQSGTTTSETDTITVSANTSGLASNSYTTSIIISDPNAANGSQTVPVTLVVTAPVSGSAELSWLANTETDLAGYKVYMGTSSRSYGTQVDVGNTTFHKIVGLPTGKTYYFAVTAYDTNGNESGYSNEATKSIP